jgi:hypothetical protein
MITWNYRVRKRIALGEDVYEIIEAYYKNDNDVCLWSDAQAPQGDSVDALREDLSLMTSALDLPVMDDADLPRGD